MEKVTIVITTYNQEKYIEETLKSVLNQKTDFEYKVLIADDASGDRTVEIVRKYQLLYPNIVDMYVNETNLGSLKNSNKAFDMVKSQYISFLDGDDYWIGETRLQKQVDFMDANPEYTMCGGNTLQIFDSQEAKPVVSNDRVSMTYSFDDYVQGKVPFVHTSSLLLRNVVYHDGIPDVYRQAEDTFENCALRGEDFRFLQHLEKGKMWVYPDIFSHYRIHEKGIWQGASEAKKLLETVIAYNFQDKYWADLETDFFHNRLLKAYENLMKHINFRHDKCDGIALTPKERYLLDSLLKDLHKRGIKAQGASKRNIVRSLLLNVVWAAAFVTFFGHTTSPVFQKLSSDQAMFALIGRGITEGLVPYRDLMENKGPLFFLLEALPQFICKGTFGIFVLQCVLLTIQCAEIDIITKILYFKKNTGNKIKIVFLFFLMLFYTHGNMAEEYDLFFIMSGLTILIARRYGKVTHKKLMSFLMGVLSLCIVWIKMNDAAGMLAIDLLYILTIGMESRAKKRAWIPEMLRHTALACAGGIAASALACGYYLYHGCIGDMLYGYITLNFAMAGEGGNAFLARWQMLFDWYGIIAVAPIMLVCYCLSEKHKSVEDRDFYLMALVITLAVMLGSFAHATGWRQHLIPLAVSWTIAGICIAKLNAKSERTERNPVRTVLGIITLIYMALFLNENLQTNSVNHFIDTEFSTSYSEPADRFASVIPTSEYDSVYGIDLDCGWYYRNDIMPAYKWLNLVSFISHMGEDIAADFESELQNNPVKWLITNDEPESYRGSLTDDTIEYILQNYSLADQEGRRYLYRMTQ